MTWLGFSAGLVLGWLACIVLLRLNCRVARSGLAGRADAAIRHALETGGSVTIRVEDGEGVVEAKVPNATQADVLQAAITMTEGVTDGE